jgi:hypothetical protein
MQVIVVPVAAWSTADPADGFWDMRVIASGVSPWDHAQDIADREPAESKS